MTFLAINLHLVRGFTISSIIFPWFAPFSHQNFNLVRGFPPSINLQFLGDFPLPSQTSLVPWHRGVRGCPGLSEAQVLDQLLAMQSVDGWVDDAFWGSCWKFVGFTRPGNSWQFATLKPWPIEIVDLPCYKMGGFSSSLCKRLPEGMSWNIWFFNAWFICF